MVPQELILSSCSTEASSSSSSSAARAASTPAIHLHDLLSSSAVQAFKTSSNSIHSLSHIQTQDGQGGVVMAVQEGKALAHIFAWQKDQMHLKLHLPEKMSCFALSPNGCWAATGSPNGHIYLWELSSGLLLASFTAHYRAITTLTFSPDSRVLISSSLDSGVHVFLVSQLIDPEDTSTAGKPYGSLSDHTLAVRAVQVGKVSGSFGGRCWTASDDGTVKMWSLHPPFELLCTFSLPPASTPTSLAIDPSERYFYVSTTQGTVYHVPLFRRRGELGSGAGGTETGELEAVGGGGEGSAPVKLEGAVIKVDSSITCLAISLSSTHLLIGTSSGTIQIHSLPSHQHLRTLHSHSGPITTLTTLLRPADLISSQPSTNSNSKIESWPIMDIKPFERMKSRPARDVQEVSMILRPSNLYSQLAELRPSVTSSLSYTSSNTISTVAPPITPAGEQIAHLTAENKRLKASLEKATKINDKMWAGIVEMKLANGEASGNST